MRAKVRINELIKAPKVRLVDHNGNMRGVVPIDTAMAMAAEIGLDLVEIGPQERPPVCRLADYGKMAYEQKKRSAEQRKKQKKIETKLMKFRPGTEARDRDIKLKKVREFLEYGHKVRLVVMFKGREVVHPSIGFDFCKEVLALLEDAAVADGQPALEGRSVFVTVSPKR